MVKKKKKSRLASIVQKAKNKQTNLETKWMPIAKGKVRKWWSIHTLEYYIVIQKNDSEL